MVRTITDLLFCTGGNHDRHEGHERSQMNDSNARTIRTISAVWRIEQAKLIAGLARITRDVGMAEDLAHDALVAALEQWPRSGIPSNPGAWLMTTAKHRAIDGFRRDKRID